MKNYFDYFVKILLIGDSNVGKTSILLRYDENEFKNTYMSTIGIDFRIKTISIDNKKVKLQIWDTAGQERFRSITTSYYKLAMGIVLVYDITSEKSFSNISYWFDNIKKNANVNVKKILVANKSDLNDERAIEYERGKELALNYDVPFYEISTKNGDNIGEIFELLTRNIIYNKESEINNDDDRLNLVNGTNDKNSAECSC